MLKISGIDPSQVNIVPYAYDPTPLIKGEIDASLDFTTNVPFTIKQGWDENLKDPAAYPPKFIDSWFKGTGRSVENEVYFNTAQKPLIESPHGIFSMSEEAIEKTIAALGTIGIAAKRDHFDTTLLEEI